MSKDEPPPGKDDEAERRQSPRAAISLRVEYAQLNAFFADYTKNISHGGTFIRTDHPLPVGTVFDFRLAVPRLPAPIALRGEVVRVEHGGMGIRFLYDSPAQRAALSETVEQLMIESLGEHLYRKLMSGGRR